MNKKLPKIVVIGSGSLAHSCIKEIQNKDLNVELYDSKFNDILNQNSLSNKEKVRKDIFNFLQNITEPTIVLLIVCEFIIPKNILDNDKLLIVNYHNSLLPLHRGRNAEAWTIYEQDVKTGITWHLVDNDVDTGGILIQKEIEITDDLTSLKLLKKQNQLALEGFKEILPNLLSGNFQVYDNKKQPNSLHLSKDIPNNGYLDLEWTFTKMKAFINAMNYSFLQTLGVPKLKYNNQEFTWEKAIFSTEDVCDQVVHDIDSKTLTIVKDNKTLTLKNFRRL